MKIQEISEKVFKLFNEEKNYEELNEREIAQLLVDTELLISNEIIKVDHEQKKVERT